MDANDLDRKRRGKILQYGRLRIRFRLLYCDILALALARIRFRLLVLPAVVCKAWRDLMFGRTVQRLREGSPGQQTASPLAQLPDDLIYLGILARLPVRSLLRFTVVCKAWRQLILGDPSFARAQARSPSPASAVLARYRHGRLDILTPGAVATAVAPPDASLSFLPIASAWLQFCSTTSGLLCLILDGTDGGRATFFVVNPATRAFRAVPYAGKGGHMACLAYDPSVVHRKGYNIVVPVQKTFDMWMFWRFSSAASSGGGGWRVSRAEVRLKPYDFVRSNPLYLGGRAHWLCIRGGVVWHDTWADTAGELPLPTPLLLLAGRGGGRCLEGNKELVAWHGRIGLVFSGISSGLFVWALSSTSSPARWEMVHLRRWDEIPYVAPPASRFIWSVLPVGMEGGAEQALGLAVRIAHGPRRHTQQHGVDDVGVEEEDVWRRELVRYDVRRGTTSVVAKLFRKEVHDDFGAVFSYHSSMAPLN